jgi:hypothetical protein
MDIALLNQGQGCCGNDRLGHRSEPEDRILAYGLLALSIGETSCSSENDVAITGHEDRRADAGLRAQSLKGIEERLKRAVREGELGAGTNPLVLARFVGAMIQGMSIQARDGASQEDLKAVAEFAVGALPFRETKNRKARTDHINRPAKSSSM